MAREGWSTANFLGLAAAPVTATPLTIVAWCRTSVTATQQTAVDIEASGATAGTQEFYLGVNSTSHVMAQCAGAANANASTTTTFVANTWFHAAAVFASPTSYSAYLNGGGKATTATSETPSGVNQVTIGAVRQASTILPWASAGTGDIAEVAIWNVDLSDGDILRLASGINAVAVRRERLVGYWPLTGGGANEVNVINPSQPMVLGGALTLVAPPPRAFMPKLPGLLSL